MFMLEKYWIAEPTFNEKFIPVVSLDVELITSATPQILNSKILERIAHLCRFPIAEFRFVVDCVAVNGCLFFFARLHFDGNRSRCGRNQGQVWRIRRS